MPSRLTWIEKFAGGHFHYTLKDSSRIFIEGEKMLGGPDFGIKAGFNHKLFQIGYHNLQYSPSLFETSWTGNYLQWNSEPANWALNVDTLLKPTTSTKFFGRFNFQKERYFVNANISYSSIDNYIYLDTNAYRRQAADDQNVNIVDFRLGVGVAVGKFHLENYSAVFKVSGKNGGENLIRLPELVNRTRFYYENVLARSAYFQIGFDINYRSAYFADLYFPFHRHFYLNNEQAVPEILYGDLFVNARIKTVTGFIKLEHFTQGLLSEQIDLFKPGYFQTLGYTGTPRNLTFGIFWKFYD